jgi:LacI family transcriptional regulator
VGVSKSKDLPVEGFGNLHSDSSLRVPLSSVDQKSERIGRRAAEIVLKLVIRKYDEPPKKNGALTNLVLKPELVMRQSSGRGR